MADNPTNRVTKVAKRKAEPRKTRLKLSSRLADWDTAKLRDIHRTLLSSSRSQEAENSVGLRPQSVFEVLMELRAKVLAQRKQ